METITNTQAIFSLIIGIVTILALVLPFVWTVDKTKKQIEAERGGGVGCTICNFVALFLFVQFLAGMAVYFFTELISIPIKSHALSPTQMYEIFWNSKEAVAMASNEVVKGALYLSYITSEAFRLTNAFLPLMLVLLVFAIVKVHLTLSTPQDSRIADYFFGVCFGMGVVAISYIGWSEIGRIVMHNDGLSPHEMMWRFWREAAGIYSSGAATTATPTFQDLANYQLPQK